MNQKRKYFIFFHRNYLNKHNDNVLSLIYYFKNEIKVIKKNLFLKIISI